MIYTWIKALSKLYIVTLSTLAIAVFLLYNNLKTNLCYPDFVYKGAAIPKVEMYSLRINDKNLPVQVTCYMLQDGIIKRAYTVTNRANDIMLNAIPTPSAHNDNIFASLDRRTASCWSARPIAFLHEEARRMAKIPIGQQQQSVTKIANVRWVGGGFSRPGFGATIT